MEKEKEKEKEKELHCIPIEGQIPHCFLYALLSDSIVACMWFVERMDADAFGFNGAGTMVCVVVYVA